MLDSARRINAYMLAKEKLVPKFTIRTASITPGVAEVDFDLLIAAWREVEDYFKDRLVSLDGKHSVAIDVDASNIVGMLNNLREENCKGYFDHLMKQNVFQTPEELHEFQPLGANLVVELKSRTEIDKHELEYFLVRFVEQVFLALNIGQYAACNMYGAHILEFKNYLSSPVNLSVHVFEQTWYAANNWNWPKLQIIPFSDSWEWLTAQNTLSFVTAITPVQKALAMLLNLSQKGEHEAIDLVSVSLVLESFLVSKSEQKSKGIKRKIKALFGEPFKERSWVDTFYNIRSDIVHGDYPIIRPACTRSDSFAEQTEKQYDDIMEYTHKGIAVILAILQNLIINDSNGYEFQESISVRHIKN